MARKKYYDPELPGRTPSLDWPDTDNKSSFSKPDWEYWKHMPEVTLLEATALSLDIEPNELDSTLESQDISKRFQLIQRNAGTNFSCSTLMSPGAGSKINLTEFLTWANNVKLDIPDELKILFESIQSEKDEPNELENQRWPWGNFTTPNLEILADAAHEWWTTFDQDDPETAPKQSDIISWLQRTHNLSKSDAKSIAKILRHPRAPLGRRKE